MPKTSPIRPASAAHEADWRPRLSAPSCRPGHPLAPVEPARRHFGPNRVRIRAVCFRRRCSLRPRSIWPAPTSRSSTWTATASSRTRTSSPPCPGTTRAGRCPTGGRSWTRCAPHATPSSVTWLLTQPVSVGLARHATRTPRASAMCALDPTPTPSLVTCLPAPCLSALHGT